MNLISKQEELAHKYPPSYHRQEISDEASSKGLEKASSPSPVVGLLNAPGAGLEWSGSEQSTSTQRTYPR